MTTKRAPRCPITRLTQRQIHYLALAAAKSLDGARQWPFDLLIGHRLDATAVLDLHLARHQQDKQFQKYRWLVPHHLYRLAAAATEGKMASRGWCRRSAHDAYAGH
jgi:hypothetical protein